jgi:hypothetical protein
MVSGVTGQSFQSSGSEVGVPGVAVGLEVGLTIGVIGEIGLGLRVGVVVANGNGSVVGMERLCVGVIASAGAASADAEQAATNMQITKAKTADRFIQLSITMKINGK